MRRPEDCRHRRATAERDPAVVHCDLVREILGLNANADARVAEATCRECCRYSLPCHQHLNPVVASLVYEASQRIIGEGGRGDCDIGQATLARDFVDKALAVDTQTRFIGPRSSAFDESHRAEPRWAESRWAASRWAAGIVTAPRDEPTLHRTLMSLRDGGFEALHIFAEPGSQIPADFQHLPVTMHGRRLGSLGNFYTALAALFMSQPDAEYYALFQDDIEVTEGLREYCERHFWPQDVGIVSLYTNRFFLDDAPGWRRLELGHYRTFGALAYVFRPAELKELLADRQMFDMREKVHHGNDAAVGQWAQRHGFGIAYHTPSLVRHTGATSTLSSRKWDTQSAPRLPQLAARTTWSLKPKPAKVGLVGWNTATGLGYLNRELAAHAAIHRWLVPRHPRFPSLGNPPTGCRISYVERELAPAELSAWLEGLDWVLFTELPYIDRLAQHARDVKAQVACVPMWEWLHPTLEWLRFVDLMICPTQLTFAMLEDWKKRFGFTWNLCYMPWPIAVDRFSFRLRRRCERFVFVNGTGGGPANRLHGGPMHRPRKAADVIAETARLMPGVPWIFYSQVRQLPDLPPNVEVRFGTVDNAELYRDGDVCVQPSRWEGLGLPLLECQAAGMPLVTCDAPPMNEYQPYRSVTARKREWATVYYNQPILSQEVAAADLAAVLRDIYQSDIATASRDARQYVEQHHSWDAARRVIRESMRA